MSRPQRTLATVVLAVSGLILLHEFGPRGLYSFHGHGRAFSDAVRVCLWLLCLTHVALCAVMWAQRDRWETAESSIFRFIAVKALFWGFAAVTSVAQPGVKLESAYLLVVILVSTIDLDVQLIRRYLVGVRESADQTTGHPHRVHERTHL